MLDENIKLFKNGFIILILTILVVALWTYAYTVGYEWGWTQAETEHKIFLSLISGD